jgi:hypothetical protein
LTKTETAYIRQWIAAGAPWPDAATQHVIQKKEWAVRENEDGVIIDASGGLAEDWTYRRYQRDDIGAFQPVNRIDVGKMKAESQHPVDFFIERKIACPSTDGIGSTCTAQCPPRRRAS